MASAFGRTEGESTDYSAHFLLMLFDQMVQAQQARDVKILGLITTMEDIFSFVVSADELKTHPVLQDIMEEILKQDRKSVV